MTTERSEIPLVADEAPMLRAWLGWHRDTLRLKTEGLTRDQLAATLPPSTLTLGGLLKHLALVESYWFTHVLMGRDWPEPWASVDWDADRDWDFNSAGDDSPEELRRLFDASCAESDRIVDEVLADGTGEGLGRLAARERNGGRVSLRWILVHMIEEYARHNGHADLIRESVDGSTGE